MKKYSVSGMSCAACAAKVEKAVSKVKGVSSCTVSLLTNSMGVEGKAKTDEIISAVEKAGYKAECLASEKENILKDNETPLLVRRLVWSLVFLFALMYISMGHMMWNWPLPSWFMHSGENHIAIALTQMILSLIVLFINKKFFVNGIKSLFNLSPNMDTLVALGSGVSFLYSTFSLFAMTDAITTGNAEKIKYHMNNLYFESAAMIVTLITVGKLLESVSKGKTTDALKSLLKLAPKTAVLIQDEKEITVPIEEVKPGDIFVVRPGENIPVDGEILEGNTSVNESALSGESMPVDKNPKDKISAGTINLSGFIKCRAKKVGKDTTLSQIIQLVSDATATKAPIAKIADKVSGIFVPSVLIISVLTFVIWILCGAEFSFSLNRAVSVLVVSCPCALGLATPVAIMVGSGKGAKNGILFKTSASLEEAGKTQIVILDKTGTITEGQPSVTDIIPSDSADKNILIEKAASLESKSEHPLSKAILKKADELNILLKEVKDFKAFPGNGLSATFEGKKIFGGNIAFIKKINPSLINKSMEEKANLLAEQGKTPLFFAEENNFLGIIAVADKIKKDSPEAIKKMQDMGLYIVMLTGDNIKTANAVGKTAGVNQIIAGVLPDEKEKVVKQFKENGKVCMVGDGINDAPSLASADSGMAIGNGTDVALDAADIVLMKNSLSDVKNAILLSRATVRNIKENLFWAFIYNIALIPLAAGVWYHLLGLKMNPMLGALAMSLSSFCVVTNALRLNFFKMNGKIHIKKIKNPVAEIKIASDSENKTNTKEAKIMAELTEKTLKIEGMMCCNCEKHVKEALEKIDGVKEALPDHEKNIALVKLAKEVSDEEFEKAVSQAGYTLIK